MKNKDIQEAAAIVAAAKKQKKLDDVTEAPEKTRPRERFRGIKILFIIFLFSLAGFFFWAGSMNT